MHNADDPQQRTQMRIHRKRTKILGREMLEKVGALQRRSRLYSRFFGDEKRDLYDFG